MNKELLTKLSERRLERISPQDIEDAKKALSDVINEISQLNSIEEKVANLDERFGFPQNSLLHLAAKFGDELSTATILDLVSDSPEAMSSVVNTQNHDLFTPLHYAAHSGNPLVAEALLAGGAENSPQASTEKRRWTPIHYASQFGHSEVVEILINSGVDKETPTGFGLTPLVVGAEFGKLSVVELMLKLGANKNVQTVEDNHRMNALHYAAVGNFKDVAVALLKAGINRNQLTSSGLSALDLAIQSDHGDMVELLITWGVGDLDQALASATENKSSASLEVIKNYVGVRKKFFDSNWLKNYSPELIDLLKKSNRENVGLINISPEIGITLNAYGILSLKHKTGLFSKKDEDLIQFCIGNKMMDLVSALRAVEQMAK
jgi:ankyrin repeat protein